METRIEGLVISKVIYRERDLICHLLLRNGKTVSVMFYGGRGGGKKMKPSTLELGYMIKAQLKNVRQTDSTLYTASEWKTLWIHEKIRSNHNAFYLMCFYFELLSRLATQDDLFDEHRDFDNSLEGIFKVTSNALFYLEESVYKNNFKIQTQLFFYLSRLIFELGIAPMDDYCLFCKKSLEVFQGINLAFEHGGFICFDCSGEKESNENIGKLLWRLLRGTRKFKYADYEKVKIVDKGINQLLFDYLCYQFNFSRDSFKSRSFVF